MKYQYNDGGRGEAGYKGTTGDCVTRAIAIATEKPYKEIASMIGVYGERERPRRGTKSSYRTGVRKRTMRKVMEDLGWKWTPTMFIGQGCKVHLKEDELPKGRLVVNVSKHTVAVIDGVVHDIYDPTRGGTRCVYGYYKK